jgi:hypothetical protein
MPTYMDVHPDLGDVTEDDIQAAHRRDLELQSEYGVRFLTYWFNEPNGRAFCLVEAPDKESAIACHKASHGLVPHDMIEVERPTSIVSWGIGRPTCWTLPDSTVRTRP